MSTKLEKLKKLRNIIGIRLNIKKSPKIEVPKNVYSRKMKHKKKRIEY